MTGEDCSQPPDGVAATTVKAAKRVAALQTGYVYHYAFAMLIGVVITLLLGAEEGGLGDERARQFVWSQIPIYYQEANCPSPRADTTEITVVAQPNAEGTWQEEWNVDCGNGTFHVFIVDFVTQDGYSSGIVQPPQ